MSSRTSRRGTSLLLAGVVGIAAVVGAGWWFLRPDSQAQTPTTPESPATSVDDDPTEAPAEDTDDLDHLAPFEGYASVDDPAQDVADPGGVAPPEPEPAADLREVELEGDGESLTITFVVEGRVPILTSSLAWSIDFYIPAEDDEAGTNDDEDPPEEGTGVDAGTEGDDEIIDEEPVDGALPEELLYTVTIQQTGQERMAAVMDWKSSAQIALDTDPEAEDDRIWITVPTDMLDQLDGPFEWQALGQLDGSYSDYAPDNDLAPFPDAEASPTPSPTPTESDENDGA